MNNIFEIINNQNFILGLVGFCLLLFILYLVNLIKVVKLKKEYKNFMNKLGNGANIQEILESHIEKINKTITKNEELERFCKNLDSDIKNCIQKMRYL